MANDTVIRPSKESHDSTERYYAEMEGARNWAEEEYFSARPQLLATRIERSLFRAGFERAYSALWSKHPRNETLQPASNERLSDTNLRNIRSWAENHLEFSSDDSGPRMIAEAMDELLMRRRAAETPEQLLSGLTEAQRELATENLLTIIDVSSALEKKTPKELVDLVLGELAAMDVSSVQELLIEELCTRVHPNWCNEDPTSEKAIVVPSICGKPMPDCKGAGQCINPPGHEGDCDDMPF